MIGGFRSHTHTLVPLRPDRAFVTASEGGILAEPFGPPMLDLRPTYRTASRNKGATGSVGVQKAE